MRSNAAIGQYPRPTALQLLARVWGCRESTAKQARTPTDPRCYATRLACAITELRHHGYHREAEAIARPVLLALAPLPLAATRDQVIDALCAEARAEGRENEAQAACADWSDAALDTWLRTAEHEYDQQGAAIRLVKAYLKRRESC